MALSSSTKSKLSRAFGSAYADAADETTRTLTAFHPFIHTTYQAAGEAQTYESNTSSGDRRAGPGGRKIVNTRWDTGGSPPRGPQESGPGTDTDADKDTDTDSSGNTDTDTKPAEDGIIWSGENL